MSTFNLRVGKHKILLTIDFQKERYGPDLFRRDVQNYLRRNGLQNMGKPHPSFELFEEEVKKELREIFRKALEAVPKVIYGDPFQVRVAIHDAGERVDGKYKRDLYHSSHDDDNSRLSLCLLELNGKTLADLFVIPKWLNKDFYLAQNKMRETIDIIGLLQYQASIIKRRNALRLRNKVKRRYGIKDEKLDRLEHPGLIPFFEFLSDLAIEGLAEFKRRIEQPVKVELARKARVMKNLNEMVELMAKPNTLKEIDRLYEEEYYNLEDSDIEFVGRWMCFFIALAIAKDRGYEIEFLKVKTNSSRKGYYFKDLRGLYSSYIEIQPLPLDISEDAYKKMYSIKPENHHARFIHVFESACKELGIPKRFIVISNEEYVDLKKRAVKNCEEEEKHWIKEAGFPVYDHPFRKILGRHSKYRLL